MLFSTLNRCNRPVAVLFLLLTYFSWVAPLMGNAAGRGGMRGWRFRERIRGTDTGMGARPGKARQGRVKSSIGGPGQPEMASFKSVGDGSMVNLFTGDFSYNIALLDVGGYPVNIYYNGGISPEQEASWVGLGWNINPGNINRNVRGIPDDFNGSDTLQQVQMMKPNQTWGLGIGADAEVFGIKAPVNAGVGVAFNNYLGPSLDLSLRGHLAFKVGNLAGSEKLGAAATPTIGIDVNSRAGASFSGNISLTAMAFARNNQFGFGGSLATGYNSRSGIKALQLSEQHSFGQYVEKEGVRQRSSGKYLYNAAGALNQGLYASSISFAKPSYIPPLRMPLTNTSWSGHFQVGLGSWGVAADVEAEVYGQTSQVANEDSLQKKPMVGYLYAQNGAGNPAAVMDFTRFNDREVTPNTPVISAPQYSYDIFSIQGEGTGGNIRAYRGDLGYMRDNTVSSKDQNVSLGADVDPPGHYGVNLNHIQTPSTTTEWGSGNKLRGLLSFSANSGTTENVYWRNPGENGVLDSGGIARIGGAGLMRFVLGGTGNSPTIEPRLQVFSANLAPSAVTLDLSRPAMPARTKRTQLVHFLTAAEAAVAGLDTAIKSYNNQVFLDAVADTLVYQSLPRVDNVVRKAHHLSQIEVTENTGKRYIYGIPVYNLQQQDLTFSVNNVYSAAPEKVLVGDPTQLGVGSPLLQANANRDGFLQVTRTPPYAHSFLLSGILSPDYVDVTGNGISEDDLGEAVKFNYTRMAGVHAWRTPHSAADSAHFHAGLRSEVKDDKAMISFGLRESWYLQSVESKNMIALFYLSGRLDGKGALGITGGIDANDNTIQKLDSIALYNKADLRANGMAGALPMKTVHFQYSYQLCSGTPDNPSGISGSQGKLTLTGIYFTYNGKTRAVKEHYRFVYSSTDSDNPADNPGYLAAAADRWGVYKPASSNPGGLANSDYPWTIQDSASKAALDQEASAWMLKKILLPSGGQFEIGYESDDYSYVQDRRAADMMPVAGFGNTNSFSAATDRLYPTASVGGAENLYAFVRVPVACSSATDVYNRYLQGVSQLAFRLWVLMPKGPEYITAYANFQPGNYGVDANNPNIIWVQMDPLAGYSPLAVTALEFLRQQLPGQAFPGYDVSGATGLRQIGDMLGGMLQSLRDAFTDPVRAFRKDSKAMHTDLTKCFVRLSDPDGRKYGGGHRVRSVVLRDNWNAMTGQYTASYGKLYTYTTTESFNGGIRTISSGVASYEPSIGGEENPLQSILQFQDNLPAGPSSYGAVEMPVLDAFYPSPVVGYSKVTVTTMKTDTSSARKSRSDIGRQVTEFYTAKDYPVSYAYTPFDAASVKEFHQASRLAFFHKYAYDYKAQSQGFLVVTNDMHGKMRSQSSYAAGDSTTRISYTENFYSNTGANGMNDLFTFVDNTKAGNVSSGNMGVDIDLMTDAREFSVKSSSRELQSQVDILYFALLAIPIPTVWPVTGVAENIYRAVTTTKVVNYHGILDSVVVVDKGSLASTKNLAYDAQTGELLVTRTNNEYNQPLYSTVYPAWWGYPGMGPGYSNIDAVFTGLSFRQGKITTAGFDQTVFESGDELLIKAATAGAGCDAGFASGASVIWAWDLSKTAASLAGTKNFIFLDGKGNPYTMTGVTVRVIRSGRRNMLDAKLASMTSLDNPLANGKLAFPSGARVINATAAQYRELWPADGDVFGRYRLVKDPASCVVREIADSSGYWEKTINPYRKGLAGNFKAYRSWVFYDRRQEYDTSATTAIATGGLLNNFKPFWNFSTAGVLVPDTLSTQWVWNSQLNKVNGKGLELETQDALGLFSSARYGYNKTLTVSVAANARYNEAAAEGFEDYGYGESLDNTAYNYSARPLDFRGVAGSMLVNTDTTAFRAHTGRYVLGVTGAAATIALPVAARPDNTGAPVIAFARDTTQMLTNLGGSYQYLSKTPTGPSAQNLGYPSFGTTNPSFFVSLIPVDTFSLNNSTRTHYYSLSGQFYFTVPTAGSYPFTISMGTSYNLSGVTNFSHSNGFGVVITDTFGNIQSNYLFGQNGMSDTAASYSVFLCPGVYLASYSATEFFTAQNNGSTESQNQYSWGCVSLASPDYLNLTRTSGCAFTRAMTASPAVENPLLSTPSYQKMLFSGWVHEPCGDPANGISCKVNSFTHSQVQLGFGSSGSTITLNPTGSIIDGWQKVEGAFLAPAGATVMSLSLVNSTAGTVYFDDVRIQPFAANLTSYVYDPTNLRLSAQLDANNFATYYEYDEEGNPVRTKVETREGIKTVTESRSALQKAVQ